MRLTVTDRIADLASRSHVTPVARVAARAPGTLAALVAGVLGLGVTGITGCGGDDASTPDTSDPDTSSDTSSDTGEPDTTPDTTAETDTTNPSETTPPDPTTHHTTAANCHPADVATLFPYALADSAWTNVDLAPKAGMAGLLAEFQRLKSEDLDKPVRIRLAPGDYAPTDPGVGELYVDVLLRTAAAPVLVEATDKAPNATRLSQGFNLVGVSFLAFDGLTIGPATVGAYHHSGSCDSPGHCYHDAPKPLTAQAGFHIAGTALDIHGQGVAGGHLDFAVYGRYAPSHDIVIRRVTIQNIYDDADPTGKTAEGAGSDGIKFNQCQDVWVVASTVRQTSRHGIDNVGVHGACFLGNAVAETGLGLGIEAKGGSVDVTYDSNVFADVRKVELGGENTDATYYWSAETPDTPEHYAYEGRRIIARNNVILDAREGALEYSGCHDCAAIHNSVVFLPDFDTSAGGGDAVREVDSQINRDGAGSDCVSLDGDYVEQCWSTGPYPPGLVTTPGENGTSRILTNQRNTLADNVFVSLPGLWGGSLNPYNHPNSHHGYGLTTIDYNYWFNGAAPLDPGGEPGWLAEGAHSTYTGTQPNPDPRFTSTHFAALASTTLAAFDAAVRAALTPAANSPLVGAGSGDANLLPGVTTYDGAGRARANPPAIGAFEPE